MRHPILVIGALILAGEAIFALPFHVARFFRATVLEVFGFSNANLGDVFAVYGITAMIAYFPGGAIADRFPPHKLMSLSLAATALGGAYMATIPGYLGMSVLFAYWGVTSILLFWAALIRSTREWGGELSQGRAFGILDGGRGLVAAGLASIAVVIFGSRFAAGDLATDPAGRHAALVSVIIFYTAITLIASVLTYWLIPRQTKSTSPHTLAPLSNMGEVLRRPIVWAQAAIVVCAYCGYKGLDNYALYAVDVLGMSEVEAAGFTAASAYLRPVAAIAAGFLADRYSASRVMVALFLVVGASYGLLGIAAPAPGIKGMMIANILISFAGVYALRGVYFALLQETRIPGRLTGTAVGLISLVGYTPDIFFAAIGGRLIDNAPGVAGHQHYFLFLAGIMLAGVAATALLLVLNRRNARSQSPPVGVAP